MQWLSDMIQNKIFKIFCSSNSNYNSSIKSIECGFKATKKKGGRFLYINSVHKNIDIKVKIKHVKKLKSVLEL